MEIASETGEKRKTSSTK